MNLSTINVIYRYPQKEIKKVKINTTNMKYIFPFFFIISLLISSCSVETKEKERPNILFIMSDDHAYQAISAYDDRLIQTPNIDRIAKEGMLFNNASVTNSICAPSRAVILTGKHSHLNGKIDNLSLIHI